MIKKTNIIVIVLLLVALGMVFYRSYFSGGVSKNVTVVISDAGFSPDSLIIEKGTMVTWVNNDSRPHWPASNFHPTHTLYPEQGGCIGSLLDACKGLSKGESFSFKFNKLGIWPMHDHLFPGFVMTIEVIPLPDLPLHKGEEKARLPDGQGGGLENFKNLNYTQQLETVKNLAEEDLKAAWTLVKKTFVVDGQVVGNAHEFAHIVGNKAFEKFGLDGVKICDETFAFGCFHGVTEKMLLTQGLANIKAIEEGCLKMFPPDKSQNYTGCIHGVGHGVYSFEGGVLKKALADCDIISEPYRQYCYDGVFMENSFTPQSRIFDPKNPWKFCTDLPEVYHRNCARYQSQVFLGKIGTPNSLNIVGKNCSMGTSILLRETCFESLGYYIAQNSLGVPADILKKCGQMPKINMQQEGMEICIKGAAIETTFQHYGNFKDSADRLCKSLTEPRRGECLNSIKNMIAQYNVNEN